MTGRSAVTSVKAEILAPPSVWLFTREDESVRLSVQPAPAGFRLAVVGPGAASTSFDFSERANLDRFRETYERDLLARGFVVHAAAERRRTPERHTAAKATPERRR